MVYLSQLKLTVSRQTGRLLADSYALHRHILMAFPEQHAGGSGRVLFRVEMNKNEASLLVQSEKEPDWSDWADLTDAVRGPKQWHLHNGGNQPIFSVDQTFQFRLRANPTKKKLTERDDPRHGNQRVPLVTPADQENWLRRKGEQNGFALVPLPSGDDWLNSFADDEEADHRQSGEVRIVPLERFRGDKPEGQNTSSMRLEHYAVDFDGILRVTDPDAFACGITSGIGPGKAFGFGLLSVARL